MQSSKLTSLARVANLASVDFVARSLTLLAGEDGTVHAIYNGAYTLGDVSVVADDSAALSVLPVVVGAKQFADVVALFKGDQDIELTRTDSSLLLRTAKQRVSLRLLNEEMAEPLAIPSASQVHATLPVDQLVAEAKIAADFVSLSTSVPLLTGVRLAARGAQLGLMAFDGIAGLLISTVACQVEQELDATIPPHDLLGALELIGAGNVTIASLTHQSGQGRVVLQGANAIVHTVQLAGLWPSIAALVKPSERAALKIPTDKLQLMSAAIKALNAGNTLVVEGGMTPKLRTEVSESGVFEITLEEAGYFPIPRAVFDLATMRLAASLGKDILLQVGTSLSIPTLVQAENRRYWISRRVE